jgi:hypothetical protein
VSIDLESQIRAIADEAFAQTTAVDTSRLSNIAASPNDQTFSSEEIIMLSPNSDASRKAPRRTKVLAIAASAIVVIAGIVALALSLDSSDPTPVDEPVPTTTIDTATTIATVDTEALAAVGERLITALDSADPDTVAALVADDAEPIDMMGAATKPELLDLFGWIEASDARFELQECVGREPDQAQCTVLQTLGWATAGGEEPAEATMFMTIENGQIVAMRYGRPNSTEPYYLDFRSFVRDADPSAPEKMWWTTSADRPFPLLTEESFELFEKYTNEYIAAQNE